MADYERPIKEEHDMDLSNVNAANFDAMVAEEAILEWLANLESEDTGYELSQAEELQPARVAG